MRFPAKANGVLFSGLLGGVLLAGIGGGVTFAEYMSFDYDDTTLAVSDASETKCFSFDIEEEDVVNLDIPPITKLAEDESVAPGTLAIEATYNPNFLEPHFYAEDSMRYVDEQGGFYAYGDGGCYYDEDYDAGTAGEYDERGGRSSRMQATSVKTIRMAYADYVSDFDIFMLNKEAILENLKNHTITGFADDRDVEITVHVNPADVERLNNENGSFRSI